MAGEKGTELAFVSDEKSGEFAQCLHTTKLFSESKIGQTNLQTREVPKFSRRRCRTNIRGTKLCLGWRPPIGEKIHDMGGTRA
jgi:hypothetical protein